MALPNIRGASAQASMVTGGGSNAYALSFNWNAPAGCPSQAFVIERARALGDCPFTLTQPTASTDVAVVDVRVLATDAGFDVTFNGEAGGQPFIRQLHTASCEEAAEATALLVAMMVQAESALEPPKETPAAVESPNSNAQPPLEARTVTASVNTDNASPLATQANVVAPPQRLPIATALPRDTGVAADNRDSPKHWGLGAALSANQAVLPSTALGVIAHLSYDYGWWRVAAEGAWLPPVDQRLRSNPAIGARLSLWNTTLRTWFCQPLALGNIDAGGVVTLAGEVGRLRGQAYGTEDATTRSVLWLAASGGVGGLVKFSPQWTSVLLVEALVPITRTEFNLRNVGQLRAPADVGSRVRLGLEARF
jgi:hypothetical protein